MTEPNKILRYVTRNGRDVFGAWFGKLKDSGTQAKIATAVDRLSLGNFGNCKSLGAGLFELRIDWGPGYRVYYGQVGSACILLLCGGDKRRQSSDIQRARECLNDYRERTK